MCKNFVVNMLVRYISAVRVCGTPKQYVFYLVLYPSWNSLYIACEMLGSSSDLSVGTISSLHSV